MRGALAIVVLSSAVILVACGSALPRLLPQWCETAGPDGGPPLCISIENRSAVDMVLAAHIGYGPIVGERNVAACTGVAVSRSDMNGPWTLLVGPAEVHGNISAPTLASFDLSQLTGDPPYLIEVVINSDLTATMGQRPWLPMDPTGHRYC